MTRRSLFGLIAAPAFVPDHLWIQDVTGKPRLIFGRNVNQWMFIDHRTGRFGEDLGWYLSHRPTGLALIAGITEAAAVGAAAAFLPLANWDCTQEDVWAWPKEVRARCAEIHYEAEAWND